MAALTNEGAEVRVGSERDGVEKCEACVGPASVVVPLSEPCRFLCPEEHGERVALASYPRSGNSLLRRLLESMTGIYTGSDTKPGRGMAELLKNDGLVGEAETSQKVWAVKCHFPERQGWKQFPVNRAILLVRHPINAIKSYFHMQLTACHHLSIAPSEFSRFSEFWQMHVDMETEVWIKFHTYWLSRKIPLMVVRYEDLLINREHEMKRIYRFMYQTGNSDNVTYSERVLQAIQDETSGYVYSPRAASINPIFEHFTEDQKDLVLGKCHDFLKHFGYCDSEGNPGLLKKLLATKNKGRSKEILIVNKGTPSRPATSDDPHRRGFPWKMPLRKIVRVVDKKNPGVIKVGCYTGHNSECVEALNSAGGSC